MADWGNAGKGAAGGAMTGAAAGSMILPGWGTAIGAGIGAIGGGLLGLFGSSGGQKYDEVLRSRLLQLEKEYGAQGPGKTADFSEFRRNQAALIAQQEAMARGEGPSAAAIQMREAMDRATAAQSSLAAGAIGHGVNAGAALRGAMNNQAAIQAQGARDLGLMRVNEQLGAIGMLGGTINQARAGDEAVNMFNAHELNSAEAARRQAQLQALAQAGGTAYGVQPSTGDAILAGGASAFPAALQARGGGQNQVTNPMPQGPTSVQPVWQPAAQNGNYAGSDWAVSLPGGGPGNQRYIP